MKAIQLAEPRQFRVIDLPEPADPGPGEAIVRVSRVGICGTDFSGYLGRCPSSATRVSPATVSASKFSRSGAGVTHVKPADRAAVEPYINCQTCYSCARHTNCCENHQTLGVHVDGGLRPLFTVPARSCTLPQAELRTTGARGDARDRPPRHEPRVPRADETVLVIDAGPIGLSVVEFARLAGSRVIVMDLNEQRLDFVRRRMGVAETITSWGVLDEDVVLLNSPAASSATSWWMQREASGA